MSPTKAETREMNALLAELIRAPVNRAFVERTFIRPAVRKAREKAREEGRREMQVRGLLHVLQRNKIRLNEKQNALLHSLPYEKLPKIDVAIDAKNASDFLRKAGLNGPDSKA